MNSLSSFVIHWLHPCISMIGACLSFVKRLWMNAYRWLRTWACFIEISHGYGVACKSTVWCSSRGSRQVPGMTESTNKMVPPALGWWFSKFWKCRNVFVHWGLKGFAFQSTKINKSGAGFKTMFGCFILRTILPTYMGISDCKKLI